MATHPKTPGGAIQRTERPPAHLPCIHIGSTLPKLGKAGRRPAPARQQAEAEDGEERDADLEHAALKEHSCMLKLHEARSERTGELLGITVLIGQRLQQRRGRAGGV